MHRGNSCGLVAKVGRKRFYDQIIIMGWNEGQSGGKATNWGTPCHPLEQVEPLLFPCHPFPK